MCIMREMGKSYQKKEGKKTREEKKEKEYL